MPSFGHVPQSGVVARQRLTPPLVSGLVPAGHERGSLLHHSAERHLLVAAQGQGDVRDSDAELTEWRPWSLPSLRKAYNEAKRKSRKMGAPRRRSNHKARRSCRFTTGTIRVEAGGGHVTLPRLGTIRVHDRSNSLRERIASGTARILSATVRHERGRWFVGLPGRGEAELGPRGPARLVGRCRPRC